MTQKDDFDNLPRQSANIVIDGWFTPSIERPLPQTVKGIILDCKTRKAPRRNQNSEYLLLELVNPIEGLLMHDGEEGEEGMLEPGMIIGIDMRQALEPLRDHRGPAKIVFLERMLIDDRNWWKTDVFFNKAEPVRPQHRTVKVNPDGSERTEDDNIPF